MMSDGYLLSLRKAWMCRAAGAIFIAVAACTAVVIGSAVAVPEMVQLCSEPYCEITEGPLDLLPGEVQAQVRRSPAATEAFRVYRLRPLVRAGTLGVAAVDMAPFAVLLFGVGVALRRLGQRGDALARALPWLRRASIAAIVWALSAPLSDSLHIMLMYPGTPAGPHWHFVLDVQAICTGLMLGIAAYAAVWALEAGLQAQRDLAEIV